MQDAQRVARNLWSVDEGTPTVAVSLARTAGRRFEGRVPPRRRSCASDERLASCRTGLVISQSTDKHGSKCTHAWA
jgi:hypothetical protein